MPKKNGAAALALATETMLETAGVQGRVFQLINAYRVRGHLFAHVDPLNQPPNAAKELDLEVFGLAQSDMDSVFPSVGVKGLPDRATLRQIIAHLSETYCGSIGVEFTHIEDPEQREWLQDAMESTRNRVDLNESQVLRVLTKLTDAEIFEQFIHKNYVGAKRFSSEGAESLIPLLELVIDQAGAHEVEEIVFGMAHRGRLNVLVNVLGKDPREIFAAFDDKHPDRFMGGGDVKYHLGYSSDRLTSSGKNVHLSLAFNPSHLEWVNPVVEGRTRAKQDRSTNGARVMPLLIHGDAAFMGQGVVPETLNMAGLEGYSTAGTIHVVVNNQIGFTTIPEDARSTRYCTDITRMMRVPVFHVNGENPEAVIQVTRLAIEFRQLFGKDVVIDMYCYRRYGHNEGDEPRFTQPLMYALIDQKPTVREVYVRRLVAGGRLRVEQADQIKEESKALLERRARRGAQRRLPEAPERDAGRVGRVQGGARRGRPRGGHVREARGAPRHAHASVESPRRVPRQPEDPEDHRAAARARPGTSAARLGHRRAPRVRDAAPRREARPALRAGRPARHVQPPARGPLRYPERVTLYAPIQPERAGEVRSVGLAAERSRCSRLRVRLQPRHARRARPVGGAVRRLPQLGAGHRRSVHRVGRRQVAPPVGPRAAPSARLRRPGAGALQRARRAVPLDGRRGQHPDLQPDDAGELFHVLRRQMHRPLRKPLVVFTPKSLLRSALAVSPLEDFTDRGFQRVIPSKADPSRVKKILLCSGKVYYDLAEGRKARQRDDVAIVRLEQLYPLNDAIVKALAPYKDGTPLVWVQEEPRNMGGWYFINARLRDVIGDRLPLSYVARAESASPATGSNASHQVEQKMLIEAAFAD